MQIKSLNNINIDTLFKAFSNAFIDYDFQVSYKGFQAMLKRRGFNPDLSFAAFESEEIVAFTLNGIGNFNGIKTAYDTGTGTLKEYRGMGLATKIFEHSIPYLKDVNIQQYLLEVLQHNSKAISVYKNMGFEIVREFNYYFQNNEEIANHCNNSSIKCFIKQIELENYGYISNFWDFIPSWQNSLEAIKRTVEDFVCIGVFIEDNLTGYCIFEPVSGDVTQIAVDKIFRRKGIASLLLQEIIKLNKSNSIRVINTDVSCNTIDTFLNSKNIFSKGKQFEMIKRL